MQQLLSIETVPISIEYKVSKATAIASDKSAKLNLTTTNGNYTIKSNPIQIRMDQFERPVNLSYTATAQYGESGSIQLDIQLDGEPIDDLAYRRMERSMANVSTKLPGNQSGNPVSDMRINFETSGLPADWGIFPRSNVKFIPGDLKISIKEFPQLIIKYTGNPIYVPRSSDPDYVAPEKMNVSV